MSDEIALDRIRFNYIRILSECCATNNDMSMSF